MTLTDKMKAWEPAAVWSEAGEGMFTVPAEAFRGVAERLKACLLYTSPSPRDCS